MYFKRVTVTYLWLVTIVGVYAEDIFNNAVNYTVNNTVSNTITKDCRLYTVDFSQCGPFETCMSEIDSEIIPEPAGTCQCRRNFEMLDSGVCQSVFTEAKEPVPSQLPNTSDPSDSGGFEFKLVLWLLIPVLLAGAVGGILYTGRQKAWLSRLYRLRVRSYNNVLVSNQDEDDPPIA